MFDRLVVSCSDKQKPRVTKFMLTTMLAYSICVVGAIVLSIVTSDARIAGLGGSSIRLAPPMMPAMTHEAPSNQSPQRPIGPRVSSPVSPNQFQAINPNALGRENVAPQFAPPLFQGPVYSSGGLGQGSGGGSGEGIPDGIGTGEPIVTPPPPARPEREAVMAAKKPDTKTPLRVSGRVLQGKAISRVEPPYPPLAKMARVSGSVMVEIIISPEGVVESARGISGHPLLMPEAVQAARGWRFQPTLLGDVPVRVTGIITFVFSLN